MQTFKVGDWIVEPNGNKVRLNEVPEPGSYYAEDCVLWQPLPGEWCWFWDNEYNIDLRKFHRYSEEENIYFADNGVVYMSYNFCEPFIGQLPTILQPQSKG